MCYTTCLPLHWIGIVLYVCSQGVCMRAGWIKGTSHWVVVCRFVASAERQWVMRDMMNRTTAVGVKGQTCLGRNEREGAISGELGGNRPYHSGRGSGVDLRSSLTDPWKGDRRLFAAISCGTHRPSLSGPTKALDFHSPSDHAFLPPFSMTSISQGTRLFIFIVSNKTNPKKIAHKTHFPLFSLPKLVISEEAVEKNNP